MKTPEEIKKGLECCKPVWVDNHWKTCDVKCPYIDDVGEFCRTKLMADAIALVQQLESAQPKWISIKEQLPTRELRVLTINGHGLIRIFGFFKRTEKAWTWIDDAGHFNHCNDITHWMPLPSTEGICLNAKL